MLSEKILLLQQSGRCQFAIVAEAMSKDDRAALIDAVITQSVSMRALERLLADEGIRIGRDSLNKARYCATNSRTCKCGFFTQETK